MRTLRKGTHFSTYASIASATYLGASDEGASGFNCKRIVMSGIWWKWGLLRSNYNRGRNFYSGTQLMKSCYWNL